MTMTEVVVVSQLSRQELQQLQKCMSHIDQSNRHRSMCDAHLVIFRAKSLQQCTSHVRRETQVIVASKKLRDFAPT